MSLLTKEEFIRYHPSCKFKHVYEDQWSCQYCNLLIEKVHINCIEEDKQYNKYLSNHSNNEALQIMMQSK